MKEKKTRIQKVFEAYAHDYRDMKLSEAEIYNLLDQVIQTLECEHQCSSNCRREGCNCECGEYHISED